MLCCCACISANPHLSAWAVPRLCQVAFAGCLVLVPLSYVWGWLSMLSEKGGAEHHPLKPNNTQGWARGGLVLTVPCLLFTLPVFSTNSIPHQQRMWCVLCACLGGSIMVMATTAAAAGGTTQPASHCWGHVAVCWTTNQPPNSNRQEVLVAVVVYVFNGCTAPPVVYMYLTCIFAR